MKRAKRVCERVVRKNITLPPMLARAAEVFFVRAGFLGLSDYVQARLRIDLGTDKPESITEAEKWK